jgi:hypothetical protein
MARLVTSPETAAAWHLLRRFVAEANRRPPHLALDSLLTIAEWMEIEQGGRLTEFQACTFAAFLLGRRAAASGCGRSRDRATVVLAGGRSLLCGPAGLLGSCIRARRWRAGLAHHAKA